MNGLRIRVADLVTVDVVSPGSLADAPRGWVEAALLPLRSEAEGDADVVLEVRESVPPPGPHLQLGMALGDKSVWVGDRLGRGALIPACPLSVPVKIDRAIPPLVLRDTVYAYLVRRALWRHRAVLVPLTVLEVRGYRIGITGWSGHGKTRLALGLMRHAGARLIGDDLVAMLGDGSVAPVALDITLRPEHRSELLAGGDRPWLARRSLIGALETTARVSRSGTVTKLTDGLAEVLRSGAQTLVGAARLGVDATPGPPGRLDRLVVVGPFDAVLPMVLASERLYFLAHDGIDAVLRTSWPSVGGSPNPTLEERVNSLSGALGGVPSSQVPPSVMEEGVEPAIRRLLDELGGATPSSPGDVGPGTGGGPGQ